MGAWWRRRRAAAQLARCHPVKSVLVLCTANRVRSPFAEHFLRRILPGAVTVLSRGVLPGGQPCPPESVHAAAVHGVDLGTHLSRQLIPKELLQASVTFVMERNMGVLLAERFPAVRTRIFPLGWFDSQDGWGSDIDDPFQLSREDYELAYARIARCCDRTASLLNGNTKKNL